MSRNQRRLLGKFGLIGLASVLCCAFPLSIQSQEPLAIRMVNESLPNPFHPENNGFSGVWTQAHWESTFAHLQDFGYNAITFYANPWTVTQWQSFMIQNNDYPKAREYTQAQISQVINHMRWVFTRAHDFGIKCYMFCHFVYTPRPFADAHDYGQTMTVSETVHVMETTITRPLSFVGESERN